ncbi:unnamed protein product [Phytomonas sp. EM1]|nr:unnamed protein product [Phytomonas sp. EM1]|eukprot:CCW65887.1 unnamed protein product [Phytomonas sp. isolate EM1]
MEFQTLSDFVLLQPSVRQAKEGGGVSSENGIAVDSEAADFEANRFPLTRSAIFSTGALGLIEKRRVMKFLKDVAPPLAEQLHAQGASPADDVRMQQAAAMEAARKATEQFAKEAASHPGITLSALLEKKYGLSPKALEIVTLMGEIDLDNNTPADHDKTASALLRSVELFRQFVTSIGLYGGSTPFLQPMFGASEMVQNFCRTSAVWGGVFVLHRSLRNIGVNHEKERQYAVLSNGQWVSAKIIVAPRELLPADPEGALPVFHQNDWQAVMCRAREAVAAVPDGGPCYSEKVKSAQKDIRWSRLVVVLRRPFLTWDHLEEPSIGTDRGKESGVPPSVVALMRAPIRRSHGSDDKTMSAPGAVVQLTQHSHMSDQTPSGDAVILHFTADAAALSQSELQEFVMKNFYLKRTGSDDNDVDAGNETRSESLPQLRFEDDDIVFSICFTLSAVHTALDGLQVPELHAAVDKPSETRHAHPYAVEERLKLQSATEKDRKGLLREVEASEQPLEEAMPVDGNATACEHVRVVSVPTLLPGLLNDSQYMEEAMEAYQQVMSLLQEIEGDTQTKDYMFMEELPDIPTF